jgi:hypothetical protein
VVLAAVDGVEGFRVAAVQVSHAGGEVRLRRLDDEVVVRPEQAVRVQAPAEEAYDPVHQHEEEPAIVVRLEDETAVVPRRRHVVDPAGDERSERSRHGRRR